MTGRICGLCSVRATRLDTTNHSGLSFWTINRTHGFGWATTYMLMLGGQDHSCCRPSDKLCYQISASMMCFSFPGMHHGWVNFINFKKPIQVTLASANRAFPSWEPGTTTTSASTTATAHTRFAASRSSSSSTSSTSPPTPRAARRPGCTGSTGWRCRGRRAGAWAWRCWTGGTTRRPTGAGPSASPRAPTTPTSWARSSGRGWTARCAGRSAR
mmetsp:Transcript_63327/g.169298  ORF Transcript_63327/g.169298 Transcript_63327/m.169298 type:complete len:214 (-) Transcript_63327:1073-1714(-)